MIIKKMICRSLIQAEEKVKQELGPDAEILLFNTLANDQIEVTAGVPEDLLAGSYQKEMKEAQRDLLGKEIDSLLEKKILEKTVEKTTSIQKKNTDNFKFSIIEFLVKKGISYSIAQAIEDKLKNKDLHENFSFEDSLLQKKLISEMSSYIKVYNPWVHSLSTPRIFCFLGASHVGKTSVIEKIAKEQSEKGKKVSYITLASKLDQSHALKGLNIPYKEVSSPSKLMEAINFFHQNDLILIDTTSFSTFDSEEGKAVWKLLKKIPSFETFIVLSLVQEFSQIQKEYENSGLHLSGHLVFTKLDEIDKPGKIISYCHQMQLSLSFVCDNATLHAPTPDELAHFVIHGNWLFSKENENPKN